VVTRDLHGDATVGREVTDSVSLLDECCCRKIHCWRGATTLVAVFDVPTRDSFASSVESSNKNEPCTKEQEELMEEEGHKDSSFVVELAF
jgi:hypothetical protein